MSLLKTSALIGRASAKWCINVPINNYLNVPGHIIQTQFVRTESQSTFASAISGNGTTITPLQINITPKLSSSLIICQWMINGEANYNNVFLIHKDGSLITTSGYEAYNNVVGNQRYSGLISAYYDNDTSSTPSNFWLQYAVLSGSTSASTYAPAIRSSGSTADTFYLNRSVSTPADASEVMVSCGWLMEIAQ